MIWCHRIFGKDYNKKDAPRRERLKLLIMIPVVGVEPTRPQRTRDFESRASANSATPAYKISGGGNRIRTGGKGFADLCLTTWLYRHR